MGESSERGGELQQVIDTAIAGEATHFLILTGDFEYHLVNETCVGVRRRGTGLWLSSHPAVGSRLLGGAQPGRDEQAPQPGPVRVGEAMCFDGTGESFRSDGVLNVEVPPTRTTASAMTTISRVLRGLPVYPVPAATPPGGPRAFSILPVALMVTLVGVLRDVIG